MTVHRQKASRIRSNLLVRVEKASEELRRRFMLSRAFSSWREHAWRSRKTLQRNINVLSFKMARRLWSKSLLRDGLAVWVSWVKAKGSPRRKLRWKEEGLGDAPQSETGGLGSAFEDGSVSSTWPGAPPGLSLPPPPGLPPPAPWESFFS